MESCTMAVNCMNSPSVPEVVGPKGEDGGLRAFRVCANETGPLLVNSHRSCGSNASLEFSRNGENLPVAAAAKGRVLAVRGSIIDATFSGELPGLHEALIVANGGRALVLQVEQLLGRRIVRTIALGNPEGLARGLVVERTGRGVHVPAGPAALRRALKLAVEALDR